MADTQIHYDIEAAVSGAQDVDALALALQNAADLLDGELKQAARQAGQVVHAVYGVRRK